MKHLLVVVGAVLLQSCGPQFSPGHGQNPGPSHGGDDPAAASTEEDDHSHDDAIQVPLRVRKNLGIQFAVAQNRTVSTTIRVPGAFELDSRARREYRKLLPGIVELLVDQYQQVQEGEVLYRYRSPSWPELLHEIIEGEQSMLSATAEIDLAEAGIAEVKSKQKLLEARIAELAEAEIRRADLDLSLAELEASVPRMEAELAKARVGLENARGTHEHALHRAAGASGIPEEALVAPVEHEGKTVQAYRTIDWIEVKARASGVVETLAVTDGAFAESHGLVLATIDPSRVRLRATALQADLATLFGRATARIIAPDGHSAGSGEALLSLGLEAESVQRTIDIIATPSEYSSWMRSGVSTFLEIPLSDDTQPQLAVPDAAVVRDGLEHVVFLRDRDHPNEVHRTPVEVGPSDGYWTVVLEGVELGDEVVVGGAYELKLASQQGGLVTPGGHFHADGTFHAE